MDHGEASCLILFFCWTVHETPSNMILKNYYITFSRHPGVVFGIRKQAKIYIYFFSKSMVKMSAEMGWNLAKHLKSLSDTELRFSEWSWNVRWHDLTCIRLYLYKRICQKVMFRCFLYQLKVCFGGFYSVVEQTTLRLMIDFCMKRSCALWLICLYYSWEN